MSQPFQLRVLGPHIGAEIVDWAVQGTPDTKTLAALEAALCQHEALVLHVPDMTPEQHLAIARHFGEPEVHTFFPNLGAGYEAITIIDSKLGDRADMWHHDESFLPSPPIVTMTHAQILPPCGGDTCWISMTTAYDRLSPRMQHYLEGLSAWHDMNVPMTAALQHGVVSHARYVEVVAQERRHLHPLVKTHPVTGRRALYLSPTYVSHIEGLDPMESRAILNYLHQHCQQVEFMFRHRWQRGDMVLWDNRSVLHNAIMDYAPHQRRMQRASVFARDALPAPAATSTSKSQVAA